MKPLLVAGLFALLSQPANAESSGTSQDLKSLLAAAGIESDVKVPPPLVVNSEHGSTCSYVSTMQRRSDRLTSLVPLYETVTIEFRYKEKGCQGRSHYARFVTPDKVYSFMRPAGKGAWQHENTAFRL